MTTVTIVFLHVFFVLPGGDKFWTRTPMDGWEQCEIAAGMVWENASNIYCEATEIEVQRPRPRP